jgi:hypothetical protein
MQIAKAQPVGDQQVNDINIDISFTCPDFEGDDCIQRANAFFIDQASDLEEALYNSLPGGTYDRLLGIMLKRKSTHFIVSHQG